MKGTTESFVRRTDPRLQEGFCAGREHCGDRRFWEHLSKEGNGFLQQHVPEWPGLLKITLETKIKVEETASDFGREMHFDVAPDTHINNH